MKCPITQFPNFLVVTPVFEDADASKRLFKELSNLFRESVFVIAVDDGSVRQPLNIESLDDAEIAGVILRLRRNVGHQRAIAIGLSYASEYLTVGQRVVVMDSDGEDQPSTISHLLDKLHGVDVVVAKRKTRVEVHPL